MKWDEKKRQKNLKFARDAAKATKVIHVDIESIDSTGEPCLTGTRTGRFDGHQIDAIRYQSAKLWSDAITRQMAQRSFLSGLSGFRASQFIHDDLTYGTNDPKEIAMDKACQQVFNWPRGRFFQQSAHARQQYIARAAERAAKDKKKHRRIYAAFLRHLLAGEDMK